MRSCVLRAVRQFAVEIGEKAEQVHYRSCYVSFPQSSSTITSQPTLFLIVLAGSIVTDHRGGRGGRCILRT